MSRRRVGAHGDVHVLRMHDASVRRADGDGRSAAVTGGYGGCYHRAASVPRQVQSALGARSGPARP